MSELSLEDLEEAWIQAVWEEDLHLVVDLQAAHPSLIPLMDAPRFPDGTTALTHSSRSGSLRMVQTLLRLGADIDPRRDGEEVPWKPLHGPALRTTPDWEEKARLLIDQGARLDIWSACGLGNLELVREFLNDSPMAAQLPGPDGLRPLHFARDAGMVQLLLSHGARWSSKDFKRGLTPAESCILDPDRLRLFLDHGAGADGFMAAILGDVPLGTRFISQDPASLSCSATPENSNRERGIGSLIGPAMRPLIFAAEKDQDEWVKAMLPKAPPLERWIYEIWQGVPPKEKLPCPEGISPRVVELAHLAASLRRLDTLNRMLDANWPLDTLNDQGWNLLHVCSETLWCEGIAFALQLGLKPTSTDYQGRIPLDLAMQGWIQQPESLEASKCVKGLLEAGSPVDAGGLPRHWLRAMIWEDNQPAFKLLLQYGADPDLPDETGRTPRDWARQVGWPLE